MSYIITVIGARSSYPDRQVVYKTIMRLNECILALNGQVSLVGLLRQLRVLDIQ